MDTPRTETRVAGRQEKPRYDLLPLAGAYRRAVAFAEGARRWGPFSWRHDPAAEGAECLRHAIEHLIRFANGDRTEDHLGHAGANLDVMMDCEALLTAGAGSQPRPAPPAPDPAAAPPDSAKPREVREDAAPGGADPMCGLAARPMRPEDLPTLKEWMHSSANVSGFDVKLAKEAKLLLVRRMKQQEQGGDSQADRFLSDMADSGSEEPLLFVPIWVSITVGCPIPRPGLDTPTLHAAGDVALQTVNFIAESQRVPEINSAVNDHATMEYLQERGFVRGGQFVRRRLEGPRGGNEGGNDAIR